MRVWRITDLTGEALRNLTTYWPRGLVMGLVVSTLIGAITWSELAVTDNILEFRRDYVAAGGNVVVATNVRQIQADRCEALSARGDVIAAGSLTTGEAVETNVAPGTLFQTAHATSGMISVWDPATSGVQAVLASGVGVGADVASELGLSEGMYLGVGSWSPSHVAVLEVDRRSPQSTRWILLPTAPVGRADTCWVEFVGGAAGAGSSLLEHVFAATGRDLVVRPWVRLDEFARDPLHELANRPQVSSWPFGGAILALLVWLSFWFRRGELSLYRIVGTTRVGLWYLAQIETLTVFALAGVVGFAWALAAYTALTGADLVADQYFIAVKTAMSTLAIPAAIGPIVVMLGRDRSSLLGQLKER